MKHQMEKEAGDSDSVLTETLQSDLEQPSGHVPSSKKHKVSAESSPSSSGDLGNLNRMLHEMQQNILPNQNSRLAQ